jgi:hypothetical protein
VEASGWLTVNGGWLESLVVAACSWVEVDWSMDLGCLESLAVTDCSLVEAD